MPRKCIMILLDGIGDRSHPELNHLTPLQAARTPVLDRFSRRGANGLYHAGLAGQALPSENAHFAMFGYEPAGFPGRGALEALGAGIALQAGDVALLAHFASLRGTSDGRLILEDGSPRATDAEIRSLVETVRDYRAGDFQVCLNATHGIRGILTLAGHAAPFVTDSDPIAAGYPLMDVVPWQSRANDPESRRTARVLRQYLEWVYQNLETHPVNTARRNSGRPPLNGLVTQRAGQLREVRPFQEALGLRGLSIASGLVYHGLATYLGMDVCKVADTARPGDDLAERLRIALNELADHEFIHVHTKGPDEAAHAKDPVAKMRVIEALDAGIGAVTERMISDPDLLIVIAADHSTPSSGPLVHSGEPVPLLFHGPGLRRDAVLRFDEVSVAPGALGFLRGRELMYMILNHLDRVKLQGLMDTPWDQPYWPGHFKAFRLKKREE